MQWIMGIQRAIDYIEDRLDGDLDYVEAARLADCSVSGFMRLFSSLSGYTVGEYVRYRRLTLAGQELSGSRVRIIEMALKYGYDSPESFTRAFVKFHGITPSEARRVGTKRRAFSPMCMRISIEGGRQLEYRIEEKPEIVFAGFKRYFSGIVEERFKQMEDFWLSTRAEQGRLMELRAVEDRQWYEISLDFTEDGFTQYLAVRLDKEDKDGAERARKAGFEVCEVPAHTCAVFETQRMSYPTAYEEEFYRQVMSEWLPFSGYEISDYPEIVVQNWYRRKEKRNRYLELWLPVERSGK